MGEDSEHLDALILVDEPTYPGVLVESRLLGALRVDTPRYTIAEIEHFFDVFKDLEDAHHETRGWIRASEASAALDRATEAARRSAG